ncbi:MAG: methyltransferase domain-containing protein [Spirochaetales bacterium]|nr:methyltransferase domain-containing protein [Spirochaetales bacterium]
MNEPYKGHDKDILKVRDDFIAYSSKTNKAYASGKIYTFLDDKLDIYMPVVYKDVLLYETRRSLAAQHVRINLLPSFEGETLLDIGCNAGYLTYYLAQTAAFCYGVDNNPSTIVIPRDILSYKNRTNVEFHECPFWLLYKVLTKPVDNILFLSIFNSTEINDIFPVLKSYCRKNIYIEPTNYEGLKGEYLVEKNMQLFKKYGEVTFLGITDYQGRGLFRITIDT